MVHDRPTRPLVRGVCGADDTEAESSDWVHKECLLALDAGCEIIPLLLRGTGLPLFVDTQYVALSEDELLPATLYDRLRQLPSKPGRHKTRRDLELAYLDALLERYDYWRDHYTPLAGIAAVRAAVQDGPRLDLPMPFLPREFSILGKQGFGPRTEVKREPVADLRQALA